MSLISIKSESSLFHTQFIKGLKIEMADDRFNKFRMYYINILIDELEEYFNSPSMLQQVLNTMQVGFMIWTDITKLHQCKNELFMFFFAAACLIVIKLRCPEFISRFKNWACGHEIDLNFVYWSERLIMERSQWDIMLETPCGIQLVLKEQIEGQAMWDDEEMNDLISTWVLYAYSEYAIYSKYDMMTITIAGSLLGMGSNGDDDKGRKNQKEILIEYVKSNKDLCGDYALCKECAEDIKNRYLNNDSNGLMIEDIDIDDNLTSLAMNTTNMHNSAKKTITRANSIESIFEAFSLYEQRGPSPSITLSFTPKDDVDAFTFTQENNPLEDEGFLKRKRSNSIAITTFDANA